MSGVRRYDAATQSRSRVLQCQMSQEGAPAGGSRRVAGVSGAGDARRSGAAGVGIGLHGVFWQLFTEAQFCRRRQNWVARETVGQKPGTPGFPKNLTEFAWAPKENR